MRLKRWGTLPLSRVMAPAIALAEKGFPVSETLAKILQQEKRTWAVARHPGHLLEERRAAQGGDAGAKRPGAVAAPDQPARRQGLLRGRHRQKIAAEMARTPAP
jgi:gamma-glutamyltranspeptidase